MDDRRERTMSDLRSIIPQELENDEHLHDAYNAYAENVGREYASYEEFMDSYSGEWDSERDFAENLADDCVEGLNDPESILARYFDYDAWTRDLFLGDYYSINTAGGVWVFRSV
jgi:antirestriction protein